MARIIVTQIFGGFGGFMFFYGLRQLRLQRHLLRNAAPVSAVITHSEVYSSRSADTDRRTLRDNSTTTHRPDVRFRYEIGGRSYESDLAQAGAGPKVFMFVGAIIPPLVWWVGQWI